MRQSWRCSACNKVQFVWSSALRFCFFLVSSFFFAIGLCRCQSFILTTRELSIPMVIEKLRGWHRESFYETAQN